ncbi:DUF3017 domain-containing protein [Streptomyces sp. NPDC017941]|uniref:DUF3017 domain-containing protein n=1 Tax=Streptomyces sp. NPDC017941 TaxID=3365018 RepID=UPI003799689F
MNAGPRGTDPAGTGAPVDDRAPGEDPERSTDTGPQPEPGQDRGRAPERSTATGPEPESGGSGDPDRSQSGGSGGLDDGEPTAKGAVSAPGPDGEPRKVSRRFPLFTRDTARPEGGGRAASGDAPAPARQWPLLGVVSLVGLGLLLTAFDVFRVGTILIGLALLAGAVLRWWLPGVGMLAVRSRFTDMVTYGSLGLVIVLLALMAQPNPWLRIPFLDDALHFTISS